RRCSPFRRTCPIRGRRRPAGRPWPSRQPRLQGGGSYQSRVFFRSGWGQGGGNAKTSVGERAEGAFGAANRAGGGAGEQVIDESVVPGGGGGRGVRAGLVADLAAPVGDIAPARRGQ